MRRILLSAALLAAACGGSDAGSPDAGSPDAAVHVTPDASVDAGPDPACVFGPSLTGKLPHVAAADQKAKDVIQALADVFAAQQVVVADSYQLPSISCGEVWSPVGPHDLTCQVTLASGTGVEADTTLAQALHDALIAAGGASCDDPAHGEFLRLQNASVNGTSNTVQFDDASNYALPPAANVTVHGAPADALVAAAGTAAIADCASDKKIFLVCNRFGATPPQCSYNHQPLHVVDGSPLVGICGPEPVDVPTQLGAADSQVVWDAVLAAAQASGYTLPGGAPLSATTVINASYFRRDGDSLAFVLVADSVQPPPPPTMPPTGPGPAPDPPPHP